MKTVSVMVQTLAAPCANRCRYCLLSWDGRTVGAPFDESRAFALNMIEWLKKERPEVRFHYSFGYSMEHPRLFEELDFLNSIGSVMGKMLQMDGMRMRTDAELETLTEGLFEHGVRELNFTFYGTREYHDRFAGRRGDHDLLLRTARAARVAGLSLSAGIPLTIESAPMAEELVDTLRANGIDALRFLVPHSEGRGRLIEEIRLTEAVFLKLPESVRKLLNPRAFMTEADWLKKWLSDELERMLIISLTRENIARYTEMGQEAVIAEAEALDESYYSALPQAEELAKMYGDPAGDRFFGRRDLLDRYRKRFIAEKGLKLYDVTDERQTSSRRF